MTEVTTLADSGAGAVLCPPDWAAVTEASKGRSAIVVFLTNIGSGGKNLHQKATRSCLVLCPLQIYQGEYLSLTLDWILHSTGDDLKLPKTLVFLTWRLLGERLWMLRRCVDTLNCVAPLINLSGVVSRGLFSDSCAATEFWATRTAVLGLSHIDVEEDTLEEDSEGWCIAWSRSKPCWSNWSSKEIHFWFKILSIYFCWFLFGAVWDNARSNCSTIEGLSAGPNVPIGLSTVMNGTTRSANLAEVNFANCWAVDPSLDASNCAMICCRTWLCHSACSVKAVTWGWSCCWRDIACACSCWTPQE